MGDQYESEDIQEALLQSLRSMTKHLSKYQSFAEKIQSEPRKAAEYVQRLQALTDEQDELIRRVGEDVFAWLQQGGDIELVAPDGERSEVTSDLSAGAVSADEMPADGASEASGGVPSYRRSRQERSPETPPPGNRKADYQVDATDRFREIVEKLGAPPEELGSLPDVSEEVALLKDAVETHEDWPNFPDTDQQSLIGYIVARARRVQDEVSSALKFDTTQDSLGDVFRRLTKYSKIEKPGFVHGLARSHDPRNGTWLEDAREIWERELA